MGVNNLWSVLAPVKKHKSLDSLRGQVLAIDLSLWICESQAVKQMQGSVIKPFLRNLFFRVNHLLQIGISLIFVIDGCPPAMKAETIRNRLNPDKKANDKSRDWRRQPKRTRFNAFLRECCCLLDCLGIPYVESYGEAESYCAFLNAAGIVNACLTDDGDAFLYGAKEVYRNFTMDSKDPHVESYNIDDIESQLEFTRNHLVAFALLVGCDYLPKGVPKIGVETTLKLFKILGEKDVLSRFKEWRVMKTSEFSNPVEANVRNKALTLPKFPHEEIIKEFLVPKDKLPKKDLHWKRPNIKRFKEIAVQHLGWTEEYALEKVVPLVTKWTLLEIVGAIPSKCHEEYIVPEQIIKTRIKQGIPCYEVKWKNSGAMDEGVETYITIEEEEMFRKCYPCFVEQFSQLQISKSQAKTKESKKKKPAKSTKENLEPIDKLLLDFEKLNLIHPETKSGTKELVHQDSDFQADHREKPQKGTKFNQPSQSVFSPIVQQAKILITSENDRMLPVKLKTDIPNCNFTPSPISVDKNFLASPIELHYSTNNGKFSKISPLYQDSDFHPDHLEKPQKGTKFNQPSQSVSSPIVQQAKTLIKSENDGILSVKLKTDILNCNFTPSPISVDKNFLASPKELHYSTNNEMYGNISPLYPFSTKVFQNAIDESDEENLFSPVFSKLKCRHLLPETKSETISKGNFSPHSSDAKLRDKQLLHPFKVSSQSTPKVDKCPEDDKDDETQYDPRFDVSLGTRMSNILNKNSPTDSLILQVSQVDYKMDKDQKLLNIASNTLPEISFDDTEMKMKNSFPISKDDSIQLISSNLYTQGITTKSKDNLESVTDNLSFVKTNHQDNLDSSSLDHSQFEQEPSILFINDSLVLNKNSSENDIKSISIDNDIVQYNYSSHLNSKTELKQDGDLQPHSGYHENIQYGNSTLPKNISRKSLNDIIISDCSFDEQKSLLGVSSTSINDSKLISTNLDDQDLLPYSSFENDSLTIKAVENTLNNTSNYSLGKFDIQATFLNDSCENQSKIS